MKRSAQLFDLMDRAAEKAFERVDKVTQTEPDPDLQLYNTLTPSDFSGLMQKYGENGVIDYIRTMETKKIMKGGTHA